MMCVSGAAGNVFFSSPLLAISSHFHDKNAFRRRATDKNEQQMGQGWRKIVCFMMQDRDDRKTEMKRRKKKEKKKKVLRWKAEPSWSQSQVLDGLITANWTASTRSVWNLICAINAIDVPSFHQTTKPLSALSKRTFMRKKNPPKTLKSQQGWSLHPDWSDVTCLY